MGIGPVPAIVLALKRAGMKLDQVGIYMYTYIFIFIYLYTSTSTYIYIYTGARHRVCAEKGWTEARPGRTLHVFTIYTILPFTILYGVYCNDQVSLYTILPFTIL